MEMLMLVSQTERFIFQAMTTCIQLSTSHQQASYSQVHGDSTKQESNLKRCEELGQNKCGISSPICFTSGTFQEIDSLESFRLPHRGDCIHLIRPSRPDNHY